MSGGSRFKVEPDPPEAGRPATVTYVGPASEVEWQVDGQPPVRIRPDANGRFRIDPMPAGGEFTLSDKLGIPGYLYRPIVSTEGK